MKVSLLLLSILFAFFSSAVALEYHLASGAAPAEETAMTELKEYIGRIVRERITVEGIEIREFHLGNTEVAQAHGMSATGAAPEQWFVRSQEDKIFFYGASPRAVLYAVYHFLEDGLGVHWWTPEEESVPKAFNPSFDRLDMTGKPFFSSREIYRTDLEQTKDNGRFAARNRWNRDGWGIAPQYGGVELGYVYPPGGSHTFDFYLPATQYLATHPEFFSLRDGRRVGGQTQGQLCLTNPEMRQQFLERLRITVSAVQAAAAKNGVTPNRLYDISTNDNMNYCQCPACEEAAARIGQTGLLLEFVNELEREIRRDYPEVRVSTLAYTYTEALPTGGVVPNPDLIIRLCRTNGDVIHGMDATDNRAFEALIKEWHRIARQIHIWDYAINYTDSGPLPSEVHYGALHRMYADQGVTGIFWEHEYPYRSDFYAMKVWLEGKLLENPYADATALSDQFLNGYYEAAAPHVREYRRQLAAAAAAHPEQKVRMMSTMEDYKFIDLETLLAMHQAMDAAEAAVEAQPALLDRVRRARLNLDRFTVVSRSDYLARWTAAGNQEADFPIDMAALVAAQADSWPRVSEKYGAKAATYLASQLAAMKILAAGRVYVAPEKFSGRNYYDFTADKMNPAAPIPGAIQLVTDLESATGSAMRLDHGLRPEYFSFPFLCGYYYWGNTEPLPVTEFAVPAGKGYAWYRLGTLPENFVNHGYSYVYLTRGWELQIFLHGVLPKQHPALEIWGRVKFAGPAYQPGEFGESYIYVERVVLAEK